MEWVAQARLRTSRGYKSVDVFFRVVGKGPNVAYKASKGKYRYDSAALDIVDIAYKVYGMK